MNRFEALIITGKLEVYVTDQKELFDEVKSMQKYLIEDDLSNLAISCGRFAELSEPINEKVGENLEKLINYFAAAPVEVESNKHIAIEDLDLSLRSYNALKRAGLNTTENLLDEEAMKLIIRRLGPYSRDELINKMKDLGFNEWVSKISELIDEIKK